MTHTVTLRVAYDDDKATYTETHTVTLRVACGDDKATYTVA